MANQLTLDGTLAYSDSVDSQDSLQISDLAASVSTEKYLKAKQSIGTSEEALVLGEVTTPGYLFVINRDVVNFVTIKTGTSGVVFAKLLPGEFAMLRLGSGAQAPYLAADTAAVMIEYLVVST